MVMQGGENVQSSEREQPVGQQLMDRLGGFEHFTVRSDSEVQLKKAIIKYAAVPDIGDDTEQRIRSISAYKA